MGSPIYCYKEILKDFILCNHKLKKDYDEIKKNLCNQTVEELENMSLKYYNTNKDYAIFMMGVCTSHFLDEWQENNDMVNACAGAIGYIYDLFNIKDEEDFKKAQWKPSLKYAITGGGNCLWACSNCGFVTEASLMPPKYNYCPNCGEKME